MSTFTHCNFLSGENTNIRVPELHTPAPSPSSSTQSCFIECEICHVIFKSIQDLGTHRREHHLPIIKKKVHSGTTPLPVSHVNQKAACSPVLLPGQIPCPVCKVGCSDKHTLVGHVGAEHPTHRYMCNVPNCFKIYISKSGLFKHKKTHVQHEQADSVLCMDCKETFKSEEECDNHQCPARVPKQTKKQHKTEQQDNDQGEGEGECASLGKCNTRSSKIKKEK